ncbi:asparagine synthase (glutamine-hydrolyzing) [Streptomyces sp. NPDC050738]|uniref:asparagine synthase (glutamine-hydrolyzing) n=1 Tax=Streptomyces sp. NPDC050738 TaxID=3154744 RepID=UPI003447F30A
MSGVVGWIDFERDLRRHRPVATAMTATLAQRGPDGESVWVGEHAALGVRLLDVDGARDEQPYVLPAGDHDIVAVVAGWPTGTEALRAELAAAGARVSAAEGPAALVAYAYRQWGTDFLPRLNGAWAVVLWDGRTEEVVLARDHLGGQPLYWTRTATALVFGSERKALLSHPEVDPVVDAAGLREAVSQALPHGGIFAGFDRIGAAEIARYGRDGWQRSKYWSISTQPHTDDYDATVAKVRDVLQRSVEENLTEDPAQLLVMLSGGVDSSAVAALAADALARAQSGSLRTFTIGFAQSEFRADVMRSTHDTPFAEEVAAHIGADHTLVELDTGDILDPIVRLGMLKSKDFPTRQYDMDTAQYLTVQRAAQEGRKVVFAGYGGDKYFQGATWFTHKDLVVSGTFPWLALAQKFGAANGFGTGLFSQDALKALDFPTYYRDVYATAVAEVEYLPEEDEWQRHMRRVAYLMNTRFGIDAGSYSSAGLQLRTPINHPELVQYAYNIPNEMHNRRGIEKGILRAAVADLLPTSVLDRHRSASPVSNHPDYPGALQRAMKAVLADPKAPVRQIMDLEGAAAVAANVERLTKDRMARADVELMLQLNLWLDHYRVRLAL